MEHDIERTVAMEMKPSQSRISSVAENPAEDSPNVRPRHNHDGNTVVNAVQMSHTGLSSSVIINQDSAGKEAGAQAEHISTAPTSTGEQQDLERAALIKKLKEHYNYFLTNIEELSKPPIDSTQMTPERLNARRVAKEFAEEVIRHFHNSIYLGIPLPGSVPEPAKRDNLLTPIAQGTVETSNNNFKANSQSEETGQEEQSVSIHSSNGSTQLPQPVYPLDEASTIDRHYGHPTPVSETLQSLHGPRAASTSGNISPLTESEETPHSAGVTETKDTTRGARVCEKGCFSYNDGSSGSCKTLQTERNARTSVKSSSIHKDTRVSSSGPSKLTEEPKAIRPDTPKKPGISPLTTKDTREETGRIKFREPLAAIASGNAAEAQASAMRLMSDLGSKGHGDQVKPNTLHTTSAVTSAGQAMVGKIIKLKIKPANSTGSLKRTREETWDRAEEKSEERPVKRVLELKLVNRHEPGTSTAARAISRRARGAECRDIEEPEARLLPGRSMIIVGLEATDLITQEKLSDSAEGCLSMTAAGSVKFAQQLAKCGGRLSCLFLRQIVAQSYFPVQLIVTSFPAITIPSAIMGQNGSKIAKPDGSSATNDQENQAPQGIQHTPGVFTGSGAGPVATFANIPPAEFLAAAVAPLASNGQGSNLATVVAASGSIFGPVTVVDEETVPGPEPIKTKFSPAAPGGTSTSVVASAFASISISPSGAASSGITSGNPSSARPELTRSAVVTVVSIAPETPLTAPRAADSGTLSSAGVATPTPSRVQPSRRAKSSAPASYRSTPFRNRYRRGKRVAREGQEGEMMTPPSTGGSFAEKRKREELDEAKPIKRRFSERVLRRQLAAESQ
ncbi:hypothetical protein V8F20_001382 [Naviculisporaceae sp. PSN 640]